MQSLFRKKSIGQILADQQNAATADNAGHSTELKRHLGVRDLIGFGIAAIVGAGIFSTIGQASADGGPGVIFLFIFTAIACGFAAFCYAEFASMVPVSGSAYTYSYVSFGELIAWIIGWALVMEYAIGNITVAISWSDYFTGLLGSMGIHVPEWMTMDYLSARNGYDTVNNLLMSGKSMENIDAQLQQAYTAWQTAPRIGGFHFVSDLPALLIILLVTILVYRGIKESRNASNFMVIVKISVVLLVILVGAFYVDTDNWSPFMPNGIGGVLKGVSAVFFAYIGFDAISTTAEECKDPQRDLPRGMLWSIVICTILYILIALVLTGMVSYKILAVGDPLAFVFEKLNLKWMSGIVAVSAVFAMASVLLVFQLGQPRIWMAMSRDGLLPAAFSRIHKKFGTPAFATIVTGCVVAIPSLFFNLSFVTDLCSIGTLFAFVLVCGGILMLQNKKDVPRGKFRMPYINAQWIMPILALFLTALFMTTFKEDTHTFFSNAPQLKSAHDVIVGLDPIQVNNAVQFVAAMDADGLEAANNDLEAYLSGLDAAQYGQLIHALPFESELKMDSGWDLFKHKIPMWLFLIGFVILTVLSFMKKFSLIPVMGVISCFYMMTQIELKNWIGFGIWLVVGLIIYFLYGRKHSKLALNR